MSAINWRTACGERNPKFLIKGTVLATAFYGENLRFLIEEYRTYPTGNFSEPDRAYRIRDAYGVTDAEMREGKTSPIVAHFDTLVEATRYCDRLN